MTLPTVVARLLLTASILNRFSSAVVQLLKRILGLCHRECPLLLRDLVALSRYPFPVQLLGSMLNTSRELTDLVLKGGCLVSLLAEFSPQNDECNHDGDQEQHHHFHSPQLQAKAECSPCSASASGNVASRSHNVEVRFADAAPGVAATQIKPGFNFPGSPNQIGDQEITIFYNNPLVRGPTEIFRNLNLRFKLTVLLPLRDTKIVVMTLMAGSSLPVCGRLNGDGG